VWQGRFEEAQCMLELPDWAVRSAGPAAGMLRYARGLLALARGRYGAALDAFGAAGHLDPTSVTPLASRTNAFLVQTLVAMGELDVAEQTLAGLDRASSWSAEAHMACAALKLARGDSEAAIAVLAPLLGDLAASASSPLWGVQAFLLEALARDTLGEQSAAEGALERALDLAEPDGLLLPFLLHPGAMRLLDRHCAHRTKHASLISSALALLAGGRQAPGAVQADPLTDPLSASETRVLRYLPTNLSKREIADELCVSVHTVKTHIHHLYSKLDVHSRRDAVTRARTLALLAPSAGR